MQPIDSSLAPLYVIGKTSQAHLCTPPNSACGTVRHAGSGLHGPYRPSLRRDHTQRDDPSAESRRQGLSLRYRAHGAHGASAGRAPFRGRLDHVSLACT